MLLSYTGKLSTVATSTCDEHHKLKTSFSAKKHLVLIHLRRLEFFQDLISGYAVHTKEKTELIGYSLNVSLRFSN